MKLNTLKAELQKDTYTGLTDLEALAALPVVETKLGRIEGDNKLDLLTLIESSDMAYRWETVIEGEAAKNSAKCKLARTLLRTLSPDVVMSELFRINLGLPHVSLLLDNAETLGLLEEEEVMAFHYLASYKANAAFEDVTVEDIALARRLNGVTARTETAQTGKDLTLALNVALPERVSVTVWNVKEGFADENLGRPVFIQNSQSYRIKLSDLRNLDTIEVRVACADVDFDVSY
jgi:hypothetical protein